MHGHPNATVTLSQAGRRWLLRSAILVLALQTAVTAVPTLLAQDQPAEQVDVLVYNYANVPHGITLAAEFEASRILAAAGVRTVWFNCTEHPVRKVDVSTCLRGWGAQSIGLRLLARNRRPDIQSQALGFTVLSGLASVYYGDALEITRRLDVSSELPAFLGSVIAHELGHVLLNSSGHHPVGIMQAHWGNPQIVQSIKGSMAFTPEQSILMREHVHQRTSPAVQESAALSFPQAPQQGPR